MRWYFVFFLVSGFCSLVYELVWLRLAMAQFDQLIGEAPGTPALQDNRPINEYLPSAPQTGCADLQGRLADYS